jgi:hypothetical protein
MHFHDVFGIVEEFLVAVDSGQLCSRGCLHDCSGNLGNDAYLGQGVVDDGDLIRFVGGFELFAAVGVPEGDGGCVDDVGREGEVGPAG